MGQLSERSGNTPKKCWNRPKSAHASCKWPVITRSLLVELSPLNLRQLLQCRGLINQLSILRNKRVRILPQRTKNVTQILLFPIFRGRLLLLHALCRWHSVHWLPHTKWFQAILLLALQLWDRCSLPLKPHECGILKGNNFHKECMEWEIKIVSRDWFTLREALSTKANARILLRSRFNKNF